MALIQYLSRIQFDAWALALLGEELDRLGVTRPLLVTDRGIAEAGLLDRALSAAKPHVPVVYDGTTENPTEASLDACMTLWAAHGCDGVVALGGGSSIDLAKAVALLAENGGAFSDYAVGTERGANIAKVAPHIAIPTAAGTGAEVGRAAVLTTHDGRKSVAVSLNMVADCVICDPMLTLTLPPDLTAATGIDALSHGIETYCSPVANPPAAAIALDCVSRAATWLPVAVEDGSNSEARAEMMMAALLGGMSLQKGLGAAHAMANPLGALGLRHGELIGILLPHALRFNAGVVPEQMATLRRTVGEVGDLAEWVGSLASSIGLPTRLSELGVAKDDLAELGAAAANEHLAATNPRRGTAEDYTTLLRSAW